VPGTHLAELYPGKLHAKVNSIHHQGIKRVAPDFVVEALSEPDGVPEAIRLKPARGRGYIAATQWHPEFHKAGAHTLDDRAILNDFLAACTTVREQASPTHGPLALRARAGELVRRVFKRQS
jgi:putative glutamine amidotransferase